MLRQGSAAGLHADIFEHTDGHHYIGNQVTASVFAAVPLLLFDPLLDYLEEVGKRRSAVALAPKIPTTRPSIRTAAARAHASRP